MAVHPILRKPWKAGGGEFGKGAQLKLICTGSTHSSAPPISPKSTPVLFFFRVPFSQNRGERGKISWVPPGGGVHCFQNLNLNPTGFCSCVFFASLHPHLSWDKIGSRDGPITEDLRTFESLEVDRCRWAQGQTAGTRTANSRSTLRQAVSPCPQEPCVQTLVHLFAFGADEHSCCTSPAGHHLRNFTRTIP